MGLSTGGGGLIGGEIRYFSMHIKTVMSLCCAFI